MKYLAILLFCLSLISCGDPNPNATGTDQCLRQEIFKECLSRIPAGPTSVVSNDWAEVVDSCDTSSWKQSRRIKKQIKPECYGGAQ